MTRREKTITVRLTSNDYDWLALNAGPEVSVFVRSLILQAKRSDENKPRKQRIAETEKELDSVVEQLFHLAQSPHLKSPEMRGPLNRLKKRRIQLSERLALLKGKQCVCGHNKDQHGSRCKFRYEDGLQCPCGDFLARTVSQTN